MSSPLSRFRNQFLPAIFLASFVLLNSGCGGSGKEKLAPVSGKVTVNGKPVTAGWVNFKPDKAKGNTFGGEPIGEINAQGEYTLETRGKPGAPLGAYKIVVTSTGATTPDNTKPSNKPLLNPTYANVEITPLAKDVVENPAPGAYDLQLSP
jgi:hypothetical protein